VAVAVAAALCASGACGGQGDAGEGSTAGGPPPPPAPADPRAGPPALLASVGERAVLLDAGGRVRRVLPATLRATTHPCPRGRWLVDASEWSDRVEARTVVGRRCWDRRIRSPTPRRRVLGPCCAPGRRDAWRRSQQVASARVAGADRRVPRFRTRTGDTTIPSREAAEARRAGTCSSRRAHSSGEANEIDRGQARSTARRPTVP
jgi:hypothetical protein